MKIVTEHLLRRASDGYVLLGSRCQDCGEHFFPATGSCTRCCGTRMEEVVLGDEGTLWSWTVQEFAPKTPYDGSPDEQAFRRYGVGYVEMPCGLKVEARLVAHNLDALRIGQALRLVLEPYRERSGEAPVYTYAFAPVSA